MIVHEAHKQGVQHIVVTHAMAAPVRMSVPQMQEAAADGAYIEFVYSATLGKSAVVSLDDYGRAIRAVGAKSCILSTDLGQVGNPLHPDGMASFIEAMRVRGFSQADLDLMTKTNPARALGLP
jgi:predicted metal-dependent phosphotriesterase family hydrolase